MSYWDYVGLGDELEPLPQPEPEPDKGWFQTLSERFRTGVEQQGVGTSVLTGRSPETIASDIADTKQFTQSPEEDAYRQGMTERAKAFSDNPSIGSLWDIGAHLFSNKKQLAGEVAQSVGQSGPAFSGALAGAGIGTAVAGPPGRLPIREPDDERPGRDQPER